MPARSTGTRRAWPLIGQSTVRPVKVSWRSSAWATRRRGSRSKRSATSFQRRPTTSAVGAPTVWASSSDRKRTLKSAASSKTKRTVRPWSGKRKADGASLVGAAMASVTAAASGALSVGTAASLAGAASSAAAGSASTVVSTAGATTASGSGRDSVAAVSTAAIGAAGTTSGSAISGSAVAAAGAAAIGCGEGEVIRPANRA